VKWPLAVLALALAGRCSKPEPGATTGPAPVASTAAPRKGVARPPAAPSLDWIKALPGCDVEHEGLFLDVGTEAVEPRRDHSVGPFDDVAVHERAGATFARVHTRRLAYDFTLLEPARKIGVSVRGIGVVSRQVSVYLDDRRVGILTLSREEPTTVSTPLLDELPAGAHTVTLRFGGGAQGADEPYAEVDWLRIGPPTASPESYAAPTLRDIVTDVVLEGVPQRSVVLRSPSTVRCALRVAPGMKLRTGIGYWGFGRGVATVRVVEDGEAPVVLTTRKVTGGTGAAWTPLELDLGRFAGRMVGVELGASDSTGGGRVAFGEPAIVGGHEGAPITVPEARVVVVIVAAGVDRHLVPPWGPVGGVPAIGKLVRDGVAFDRYRAPTTVVGAVIASLLSGVSPRAHGLEDPFSRLGDDVRLVGERVREGSTHSGFFTGVPMSFPAFGFERGWDRYESFSPVKDVPATEPYTRGAAWLKEQLAADKEGKVLLVVHGRGGHPPWDVTRDEVALLPPEEYGGALEPRAGALVLSNLRGQKQRGPVDQRLSGDDWRRLRALEETAFRKQDAGVRRILDVLEREGLYDGALIVFMGDVAVGDPPIIPFAPAPPLRDDVLMSPLVVKFPRGALAGTQVSTMVTTTDVTRTMLHALHVGVDEMDGTDLFRLAKGDAPLDGHPLVATLGSRYSTRLGPWLLTGELGRRPTLCQTDVDPACVTDASAQNPLAAAELWRRTYRAQTADRAARGRSGHAVSPAGLDADTQAALKVFGY
jgi:hypothetical protein